MLENSDINAQSIFIEPNILVDELSTTEIYVGTSKSFNDPSKSDWKIKRIVKIGSIWKFQFPDGEQDFNFVWDDRLLYTYK